MYLRKEMYTEYTKNSYNTVRRKNLIKIKWAEDIFQRADIDGKSQ